jgi:acyl transferase domain-containing protein
MDDTIHARRALADAWTAGVDPDWLTLHGGPRRRIPLPTYPFARDRHWIEAVPATATLATESQADPVVAGSASADVSTEATVPVDKPVSASLNGTRRDHIRREVTAILADLSGLEAATMDTSASFTDYGFDSLFLTQANAAFRKRFGVRVTLGQLLGETPTIATLADRIDAELGPEVVVAEAASPAAIQPPPAPQEPGREPVPVSPIRDDAGGPMSVEDVGWLITEQLRIMEQQLDAMRSRV